MADYSNADKLMAVVSYWSEPLIAQLPPQLYMLSPIVIPVLKNALSMIPDGAIPHAAKAIVDNAILQGGIQIWKIKFCEEDLKSLQHLLELNLPCEDDKPSGYSVITE